MALLTLWPRRVEVSAAPGWSDVEPAPVEELRRREIQDGDRYAEVSAAALVRDWSASSREGRMLDPLWTLDPRGELVCAAAYGCA